VTSVPEQYLSSLKVPIDSTPIVCADDDDDNDDIDSGEDIAELQLEGHYNSYLSIRLFGAAQDTFSKIHQRWK
jgi:hypothetical protein